MKAIHQNVIFESTYKFATERWGNLLKANTFKMRPNEEIKNTNIYDTSL